MLFSRRKSLVFRSVFDSKLSEAIILVAEWIFARVPSAIRRFRSHIKSMRSRQFIESQSDESKSLFIDIGFEVDPDMHRLVIKNEIIAGIPSISFLNLISTHNFELSHIKLEN